MTTAMSNPASPEVGEIDRSARCSLSFLLVSSFAWLVFGGILALINLVQLHTPTFLADCSIFTFGRLQAMQETALIYGWAANAGLAVALWLLARLGGSPLRGANYVLLGGIFWSLGVQLAIMGIALGDQTSFAFLQMPRYAQPILLFAFAAVAAPGVLVWTGRRNETTYATQWYAVAALFLFPWFFSVAQVMLIFSPVRGVLQAVVAAWFAQNLFSLWLAPLAMAALYYLVPKIKGKVVPSYDFAIYGFWSLLLFGTWMGGRHLIGGPVPAWIPTMGITATVLVLFHHMIVFVNLRGVFTPGGSTVLKFAAYGFGAYLLGAVVDVVISSRAFAVATQFTLFQQAQTHLGVAAFSMIMFAAIYFLAPRLVGAAWPSAGLIRAHYVASAGGFTLLIASLAIAGWKQGVALNDASVSFEMIASQLRPWLLAATAAQALLIVGNLSLGIHFVRLFFTKSTESTLKQFSQPATLEASVS